MRQTSIWSLVWIGLAASPLGWLVAEAVQTWTMRLPPIPWILPALLLFCVVLLWLAERMVRGWISERRFDQRMNPLRVARLLALAKASAVFGAVATGAYTGIAVHALGNVTVPAGRNRLLMAGIVVLVALAMTVVGIRLERACRVPPGQDRNRRNGDGHDDGGTRADPV